MSSTSPHLGIYETTAQLDHDTQILLEQVLTDLASRGVARSHALASVRRIARTAW